MTDQWQSAAILYRVGPSYSLRGTVWYNGGFYEFQVEKITTWTNPFIVDYGYRFFTEDEAKEMVEAAMDNYDKSFKDWSPSKYSE